MSSADGRRLTAYVVKRGKDSYEVALHVSSTDGAPLQGPVRFHLHDSYPRSLITIKKYDTDAILDEITATEAFTVGVEVLQRNGLRTALELDLEDAFEKADRITK